MNTRLAAIGAAVAALALAGCEQARHNSSWESGGYVLTVADQEESHANRGVGPVKQFNLESLDAERAQEGMALFQRRCTACHRMEERYVGPALAGVTTRREPEWILNMVLRTELMLKKDPVALELLSAYTARMVNQSMEQHDAESVLAFFREYDRNPAAFTPGGTVAVPGAHPSLGVGPVSHVDIATLDPARAPEGEKLFKERCSACHRIGERYIGPALAGVTKRRQPEWILNMILKPELMVRKDPVAMELLAAYLTPMANQGVTRNEAEAILVYFRAHDKDLPDVAAEPVATAPEAEVHKGPPGTN